MYSICMSGEQKPVGGIEPHKTGVKNICDPSMGADLRLITIESSGTAVQNHGQNTK